MPKTQNNACLTARTKYTFDDTMNEWNQVSDFYHLQLVKSLMIKYPYNKYPNIFEVI